MAPRVTPGRCTKCPASCHRCPLSLYLRNLFLLLARSFSLFHTLLLIWVLEETQMPLLPHINVMYYWSQEGAVFFFPPQNPSCSLSVCSYSVSCSLLALLFFLQLLSILVFLFSKHWKRELNIWRVCAGEPLSGRKKKDKTSCRRCEHTDPAMLNLAAAGRHIPDTSDNNFTTGFQPPLQRSDRLTFTTRFWLELTWVRTGPWGKTAEWGLNWPDRRWLCLMLARHRHRWTDQPQPDLFVCV